MEGQETSSDRSRDEQTISEVRNSECPICLNSMENEMTITTRCLHTFCYDCLRKHMNSTKNINENRHRKCPCCRENLFYNDDNINNRQSNRSIPPPFPIINNSASGPPPRDLFPIINSIIELEEFQNELENELNVTSSEIQEIVDYYIENRNEEQVEDQTEENNNEESVESVESVESEQIIDNNNSENQPTYLEHINNNEVTYNNNCNIFHSMLMDNLNNRIMNNSNIPERIMEGEGLQNVTLRRG